MSRLEAADDAKSGLVFDLDIYRLLIREFRKPNGNIIELPARSS